MKTIRYLILIGVVAIMGWHITACGGSGGGGEPALPDPGVPSDPVEPLSPVDSTDSDADGDGFLASESDCNDLDAAIHPDAVDLPDINYIDSNCDGIDGTLAKSYWVAPNGSDNNPGTIDEPFLTISKGADEAQINAAGEIDVYVVEGTYTEDVLLFDGVRIYGGYGPLVDGSRERDISSHVSKIEDDGGITVMILESVTGRESAVQGFALESDSDGPALAIITASPEISYNDIRTVDCNTDSIPIYVTVNGMNEASEPYIHHNTITAESVFGNNSRTIGIIVYTVASDSVVHPVVEDNTIVAEEAKDVSAGIDVFSTVAGGEASLTARRNDIRAGQAVTATVGIALGYNFFTNTEEIFHSATIDKNTIEGGVGSALSSGVGLTMGTLPSRITNNFITGGFVTALMSAGLYVKDSPAHILNNTINGGDSVLWATAVWLGQNSSTRIENNILLVDFAQNTTGIHENTSTSDPATLKNNLFADGMDSLYHDFALLNLVDIAAVNALADILDDVDNIAGDPGLVDVANGDYHLTDLSDAIDNALPLAEITADIDGESRPELPDIGADEF